VSIGVYTHLPLAEGGQHCACRLRTEWIQAVHSPKEKRCVVHHVHRGVAWADIPFPFNNSQCPPESVERHSRECLSAFRELKSRLHAERHQDS